MLWDPAGFGTLLDGGPRSGVFTKPGENTAQVSLAHARTLHGALRVPTDRRIEDADDSLPKHKEFISSQLAFGKYLLAAKRGK